MYAGNPGQAVPLVAAPFAPTGQPVLAVFILFMGTNITAAAADAGLVTSIECSGVHVALLSFHIVFLRLKRCRNVALKACGAHRYRVLALYLYDVYRLKLQRSNTTVGAEKHPFMKPKLQR